jgi:hypothetical protein
VEQATSKAPDSEPAGVPLETNERLSDSLVWRLQRESYSRRGEKAWLTDQVPYYVTSNTFIAGACARVVLGHLRDRAAAAALDFEAPSYVVELAGGSGQFGFLFLKKLLACVREIPALARLRLRYVMTDLAPANVEAWRSRDSLKPFVEAGLLDFATFDLERDTQITLVHSGETLSAGSLRNPLSVIAHYTFDTTAQDVFWVREGALHEGLVTTLSSREEPDLTEPELLARLTTRYEQRPARSDYYDDEALNRVLAGYRSRLGNTSFLFPIGALKGIRSLMALAGGRLLLLSGDKGYTHEAELVARGDPELTLHGGQCFSMMVNYHAIGLYFRERGGRALHAGTRDRRLKVSAFLLGGGEDAFPETESAFGREIDGFGPCEYYALAAGIRKQLPAAPLDVILALVKLGGWDPHLVFHFAGPLAEQAKSASETLRHELVRALEKCWEHFYPMDLDLPFELGRIYAALDRPTDALRFYLESLKRYHEHPATLFNVGLCLYRLQRPREALAFMERALGLNEGYAPAREWRVRIQGELAGT